MTCLLITPLIFDHIREVRELSECWHNNNCKQWMLPQMIKRNHRHWTVHLYKLRHCQKTILIRWWTTLLLTPTQAGAWFRHLKMHMVLGCIAWTCVNLRAWSTCRYCNLWTDVACTAFGYKVSWCETHTLVAWLITEGLRSLNEIWVY